MHAILSLVRGQRTADIFQPQKHIMKSQDIFILLKLVSLNQRDNRDSSRQSVRMLAELTGVGKTEVSKSLNRSISVSLAKKNRTTGLISVNRKALFEFTYYGLQYVFPAQMQALTRGVPTAFAAPVLKKKLFSPGQTIPVWPSSDAQQMGQAIQPLYKTVPKAIANDNTLYAALALVDAIRIGNAREKNSAASELRLLLALD